MSFLQSRAELRAFTKTERFLESDLFMKVVGIVKD
jgi:hypothetical protein